MEGSFAGEDPLLAPAAPVPARKKRAAALRAMNAISTIHAWEDLPPTSGILREIAVSIDAELCSELTEGHVCAEDLAVEVAVGAAPPAHASDEARAGSVRSECSRWDASDADASDASYDSSFIDDEDLDELDDGDCSDDEGVWIPRSKRRRRE